MISVKIIQFRGHWSAW